MKMPSPENEKRCLEIRKRSKRGDHICREDMKFTEKMFKSYREWYKETEEEVFNDTVPYGSSARYKD
jgi:hypothetical protein